ncbi:MAG: hypothetical protein V2A64_01400 [Candidatus Omnitrophota bacterium]
MTAKKLKTVKVEKNDYKIFLKKAEAIDILKLAERFYRWTTLKPPAL